MTDPEKSQPNRLLRLKDVMSLVSLSKSTIYVAMKSQNFPIPVKLSSRAIGFHSSEIRNWMEQRKRK